MDLLSKYIGLSLQNLITFSPQLSQLLNHHMAKGWAGLVIKSGGMATITDVEIQNTNVGIKSEGTLMVDNLTVRDSYLG